MAKPKQGKPQPQVSKHQLSRWEKQKRMQRITIGIGALIVAGVMAVIGIGWYLNDYQPRHQPAVSVNGVEFNMDYYSRVLALYAGEQPSFEFLSALTDEIARLIQQNELARQEAAKLGIIVDDAAVEAELENQQLPRDDDAIRSLVRSNLLLQKLRDEYFGPMIPQTAEHRHVMAMFLESESQANDIKARLEDGEDFGQLAAELSLDDYSKAQEGDFDMLPEGLLDGIAGSSVLEARAFSADVGIVSPPVQDEEKQKGLGYWLVEVLEKDEEQVHIRAMLLGSEEEALEVSARLKNNENFAALAREFSQEEGAEENGGDFGWLPFEALVPGVQDFVSTSDLGVLSEPISDEATLTKGGYWLLKVLEKEDDREISEEARNLLISSALREWISSQQNDPQNTLENYLDSDKKLWAIQRVFGVQF